MKTLATEGIRMEIYSWMHGIECELFRLIHQSLEWYIWFVCFEFGRNASWNHKKILQFTTKQWITDWSDVAEATYNSNNMFKVMMIIMDKKMILFILCWQFRIESLKWMSSKSCKITHWRFCVCLSTQNGTIMFIATEIVQLNLNFGSDFCASW